MCCSNCHANCCPKTPISFHWLGTQEFFGIRSSQDVLSRWPPSKKWNSLSLVPLTKRVLLPVLRLWPIIWLLSSSSTSPCHAIHSGYYNDLYIPFSVQPTWGYGVRIAWPRFPTASAVSHRAVSSNTDREEKLNLTSLLSVAYHVTKQKQYMLKRQIYNRNNDWLNLILIQFLMKRLMFG